MMKQCETCFYRESKDCIISCQCAHIAFAHREILKSIPLIGKLIPDYECEMYERYKPMMEDHVF